MEWIVKRKKDDELMHYGIKDMHWNERRYQDETGKYTPEGLKRRREKYAEKRKEAIEQRDAKKKRQLIANEFLKLNSGSSDDVDRLQNEAASKLFVDGFFAEMSKNPDKYSIVRVGDEYIVGGSQEEIARWAAETIKEKGLGIKDIEGIGVYDQADLDKALMKYKEKRKGLDK